MSNPERGNIPPEPALVSRTGDVATDIFRDQSVESGWLIIETLVTNPDILTDLLSAGIPYIGNMVRSYRTSKEFQAVFQAIQDQANTTDSIRVYFLRAIEQLRRELQSRVDESERDFPERLQSVFQTEELRKFYIEMLVDITSELRTRSWPSRVKGYSRFLLEAYAVPQPDRAKLQTLRHRYDQLEEYHMLLVAIFREAHVLATSLAAKRELKDRTRTERESVLLMGKAAIMQVQLARERPTAVLDVENLSKVSGFEPDYVRTWMTDLERLNLVQHVRTFDMGIEGPFAWAMDPLMDELGGFVFLVEDEQSVDP